MYKLPMQPIVSAASTLTTSFAMKSIQSIQSCCSQRRKNYSEFPGVLHAVPESPTPLTSVHRYEASWMRARCISICESDSFTPTKLFR